MWKCPICSNEENGIYICQKCGYDKRKDFVRHRTLSRVLQTDADALAKLISDYDAAEQAKKAAAAKALLDVIKKEQEKKAEEERKAKEAAEAVRIEAMRRIEDARRADEARRAEEARRLMEARRAEEARHAEEAKRAEETRRQQEEARERMKKNSTSTAEKKKTPKIFRFIAGFIVLGLIGFVGAMVSQKESEEENRIWYTIKQASIQALSNGTVDYTTEIMEDLQEQLRVAGFELSETRIDENWYSRESGIQTAICFSGSYWSSENTVQWIEYTQSEDAPGVRHIAFSRDVLAEDSMDDVTVGTDSDVHVPLPMDIHIGDSYEMVCAKLGLSDAGIEPGTYTLNEPEFIYVNYMVPEAGSDSAAKYIYIGGDTWTFEYFFSNDILTDYWADFDIDNLTNAQNTYILSDPDNSVNRQNLEDVWYNIAQTSVQALSNGHINYEAVALNDLKSNLTTSGYDVSNYEDVLENAEGEMITYLTLDGYMFSDGVAYYVNIFDRYKEESTIWFERTLSFGNSNYSSIYSPDQTMQQAHNEYSPLPMGICLDDSFETVSRKLGLLREDIIPGSYSWDTQGHIYVEYTPPEENMDGEIYISKDNYSFSYWFEPQGKLYSYTVDIY